MDASGFTRLLKDKALSLGFDACGAAPAGALLREDAYLRQWLAAGNHAGLSYLERNVEKRSDVRLLVAGARSVFMLLLSYKPPVVQPAAVPQVACYAYGEDYHDAIRRKLNVLVDTVRAHYPHAQVRGFVDSAPVFEKAWAARAGLGWIGKNNLLVSPVFGSFVFLATLITSVELVYDEPLKNRCGRCARCMAACPTGALEAPRRLNAGKCISYQTKEHKGDITVPTCGYIFGCDLCQLHCPWNRAAPAHTHAELMPQPEILSYTAAGWLSLDEAQFDVIFARSPLQRVGLNKIQENVRKFLQV
ncbi:MAG: tRNA epoxyqueuosine(34) reductase QueG [Prevotellaceae bacterium]|jgi:epoxyqueuosine reductase|nr:tRNA epoxyqueuosine(34) reductase QueG [Prevotellaceae bacterium]